MVGYEISLPDEDAYQDPEVPEFEKLTQDSIFTLSVDDPELEDALQDAMPPQGLLKWEHMDLRK